MLICNLIVRFSIYIYLLLSCFYFNLSFCVFYIAFSLFLSGGVFLSFSDLRSLMVFVLFAAVGVFVYLYGLPGRDR